MVDLNLEEERADVCKEFPLRVAIAITWTA